MPKLYKDGVYEDCSVQTSIIILNPNGKAKSAENANESVRQKYAANQIHIIAMTGDGTEHRNIWDDYRDPDYGLPGAENPLEQPMVRGGNFSVSDLTALKNLVRRLIEKHILPHIEKKIKNVEKSVADTRKGIKNQFKLLLKKPERGDNDGLRENFRMNKSELELRNLIDLAFVCQDYETS